MLVELIVFIILTFELEKITAEIVDRGFLFEFKNS